jgi:hypothetical protein
LIANYFVGVENVSAGVSNSNLRCHILPLFVGHSKGLLTDPGVENLEDRCMRRNYRILGYGFYVFTTLYILQCRYDLHCIKYSAEDSGHASIFSSEFFCIIIKVLSDNRYAEFISISNIFLRYCVVYRFIYP